MNVIARRTLTEFWTKHPETETALKEWFAKVRNSQFSSMNEVTQAFSRATVLNGERVKFDILGGNYRLVVAFKFTANVAWIKFVGTHQEYDRVDALTVGQH